MELTKENAQSFLLYLCEEMPKQEKRFCELDSVVGDGDHGVTITRGFTAAKEAVSSCNGTPEDLFAEMGDYKTLWANDFKHEACETFRKHFGDIIVEGDIEQIDPYTDKTIPNCDLVLGGFPCQDFSIIWKRPGLNGERGNLYKSFLRFVDAKKPKAFVAENVKGILTANGKKRDSKMIL